MKISKTCPGLVVEERNRKKQSSITNDGFFQDLAEREEISRIVALMLSPVMTFMESSWGSHN